MLLSLCALFLPALAQDERLDAEALVDQGWLFVPAYTGEHRACLPDDLARETAVGAHLFTAAAELDPEHLRALWSLGHAQVLLAETERYRGREREAWGRYATARAALTRALELDGSDPWALYARGTVHASMYEFEAAYEDLELATQAAAQRAEETGADSSEAWLRFKALQWRPEVLMRGGDFDRARAELKTFHEEFSNNAFPLEIALAESFERERDFAGAGEAYRRITEGFPDDHQAFSFLGYLAGLKGDLATATEFLQQAVKLELQPGLYTRLWLWILATEEVAPAAEEDLRAFLEYPPPGLSAWDQNLGKFLLGEGSADDFLASAKAEIERRIEAGENLDDLMCECQFYVGLRHQRDAQAATGEERERLLRAALDAHRAALAFRPDRWKWEWGFARAHFAGLAAVLQLETALAFSVDGSTLKTGEVEYELVSGQWHVPLTEQTKSHLDRAPQPGDLFLARIKKPSGNGITHLLLVVDAR